MANFTLLSDFGLVDASLGKVRGIMLQHMPEAVIADISHEVAPFDVGQASYLLATSYGSFPEGTIHVVLVDVFFERLPKLVLCSYDGHYFLAPDNGVLNFVLNAGDYRAWICFEMTSKDTFERWVKAAAHFGKLLQTGRPETLNLPSYVLTSTFQDELTLLPGDTIACKVVYIDVFGNVVLNITKQQFDRLNRRGQFKVRFMHVNEISRISSYYNDVKRGEELCRFNSKGYLEICVNRGSAANLFGFRMKGNHNEIKITFE